MVAERKAEIVRLGTLNPATDPLQFYLAEINNIGMAIAQRVYSVERKLLRQELEKALRRLENPLASMIISKVLDIPPAEVKRREKEALIQLRDLCRLRSLQDFLISSQD